MELYTSQEVDDLCVIYVMRKLIIWYCMCISVGAKRSNINNHLYHLEIFLSTTHLVCSCYIHQGVTH